MTYTLKTGLLLTTLTFSPTFGAEILDNSDTVHPSASSEAQEIARPEGYRQISPTLMELTYEKLDAAEQLEGLDRNKAEFHAREVASERQLSNNNARVHHSSTESAERLPNFGPLFHSNGNKASDVAGVVMAFCNMATLRALSQVNHAYHVTFQSDLKGIKDLRKSNDGLFIGLIEGQLKPEWRGALALLGHEVSLNERVSLGTLLNLTLDSRVKVKPVSLASLEAALATRSEWTSDEKELVTAVLTDTEVMVYYTVSRYVCSDNLSIEVLRFIIKSSVFGNNSKLKAANGLLALGKTEAATKAYLAILEDPKASADDKSTAGDGLRELGEIEAAKEGYRAKLSDSEGYVYDQVEAANKLMRLRDVEAVRNLFRAVIANPNSDSIHKLVARHSLWNLADCEVADELQELRDIAAVKNLYLAAIADPYADNVYKSGARESLQKMGETEAAVNVYLTVLANSEAHPYNKYYAAESLEMLGETEAAMDAYHAILEDVELSKEFRQKAQERLNGLLGIND